MKHFLSAVFFLLIIGLTSSTWAAKGAIPERYHGMWAAGSCNQPKYYLHVEGSGLQMYGPDRRTPMGNWDVREVEHADTGIRIDAPESNTQQQTHMDLIVGSTGGLSLSVDIGGKGGTDQLESCQ